VKSFISLLNSDTADKEGVEFLPPRDSILDSLDGVLTKELDSKLSARFPIKVQKGRYHFGSIQMRYVLMCEIILEFDKISFLRCLC
jgi:hypothetical protein